MQLILESRHEHLSSVGLSSVGLASVALSIVGLPRGMRLILEPQLCGMSTCAPMPRVRVDAYTHKSSVGPILSPAKGRNHFAGLVCPQLVTNSYGLYSYGLYSYGLCSYGLHSYGL